MSNTILPTSNCNFNDYNPPKNPYAEQMDKRSTELADILMRAVDRAYKDKIIIKNNQIEKGN